MSNNQLFNRISFSLVFHPETQQNDNGGDDDRPLKTAAGDEDDDDKDDEKFRIQYDKCEYESDDKSDSHDDDDDDDYQDFGPLTQPVCIVFDETFRPCLTTPLCLHVGAHGAQVSWPCSNPLHTDAQVPLHHPYYALHNVEPIPFFPSRGRRRLSRFETGNTRNITTRSRRKPGPCLIVFLHLLSLAVHAALVYYFWTPRAFSSSHCIPAGMCGGDDDDDDLSRWPRPDVILRFDPLSFPKELESLFARHMNVPLHLVHRVPSALDSYQQRHRRSLDCVHLTLKERQRQDGHQDETNQQGPIPLDTVLRLTSFHLSTMCSHFAVSHSHDPTIHQRCDSLDRDTTALYDSWHSLRNELVLGWTDTAIVLGLGMTMHLRYLSQNTTPPIPSWTTVTTPTSSTNGAPLYHNHTTASFFDAIAPYFTPGTDVSLLDSVRSGQGRIQSFLAELRRILIDAEAFIALAEDILGPISLAPSSPSPPPSPPPPTLLSPLHWLGLQHRQPNDKPVDMMGIIRHKDRLKKDEMQYSLRCAADLLDVVQQVQSPLTEAQGAIHKTMDEMQRLINAMTALASTPIPDAQSASATRRFDEGHEWWRGSHWVSEEGLIGAGGLGGLDLPGGRGRAVRRTMYYLPRLQDISRSLELQLVAYRAQADDMNDAHWSLVDQELQLIKQIFASRFTRQEPEHLQS
ncbi:hypothetical protein CTA2_4033 [Colletotrichum tanaceti]|uniref:Uncharacterized protein n=1 Tax=Colletotrichum tanaceti TaxID=1306861 RepID=A0A4U6XVJ2_9PEZI|nr:hypothetical protein CTA2_4033 [Colletotrichum tanaceti]TKW60067.1 hypothetical protein CTA1_3110 [Colletotrichum tanaceti]